MADGSLASVTSLKGKVSAEEWQARVDLAALYRLVALYGWDDAIYTHISARLPGRNTSIRRSNSNRTFWRSSPARGWKSCKSRRFPTR